jgi:hypothetical protein
LSQTKTQGVLRHAELVVGDISPFWAVLSKMEMEIVYIYNIYIATDLYLEHTLEKK